MKGWMKRSAGLTALGLMIMSGPSWGQVPSTALLAKERTMGAKIAGLSGVLKAAQGERVKGCPGFFSVVTIDLISARCETYDGFLRRNKVGDEVLFTAWDLSGSDFMFQNVDGAERLIYKPLVSAGAKTFADFAATGAFVYDDEVAAAVHQAFRAAQKQRDLEKLKAAVSPSMKFDGI